MMIESILLGFIGMPGPMEMIIIGVIAVLLFGKRLPEVGRSLGKGIVEFKKGIHGVEEEIDSAASESSANDSHQQPEDRQQPTAPKFEPPSGEPKAQSEAAAEPEASKGEGVTG